MGILQRQVVVIIITPNPSKGIPSQETLDQVKLPLLIFAKLLENLIAGVAIDKGAIGQEGEGRVDDGVVGGCSGQSCSRVAQVG